MKALLIGLLAAGLPLGSMAEAEETRLEAVAPTPDPRIRTIAYDPGQVVSLTGVLRTATQIIFDPGETILHVAAGDALAWDIAAEKNILFLKPKFKSPPTNLLVATAAAAGEARNYTFALTSREASARAPAQTVFVIRFEYPQQQKQAQIRALDAEEVALRDKLVKLRLERGVVEGPRNLAYEVEGAQALEPSEISDNGRFTVLRFPGGQSIPAIYTVGADGEEALAAFDVRGEFVVVHAVAKRLRLRAGDAVLCIYNLGHNPDGVSLGTHTASSQVERVDEGAP